MIAKRAVGHVLTWAVVIGADFNGLLGEVIDDRQALQARAEIKFVGHGIIDDAVIIVYT